MNKLKKGDTVYFQKADTPLYVIIPTKNKEGQIGVSFKKNCLKEYCFWIKENELIKKEK